MSTMKKLCILGDVLLDYTITPPDEEDKMRLGGIFHAARAAWAIEINYELAYFSPAYLDEQIVNYSSKKTGSTVKIGNITGSPNVILIKESKEIGDQGYELLLRDERKYQIDTNEFKKRLLENYYSQILLFTGGYDLKEMLLVLRDIDIPLHIDIANDIGTLAELKTLDRKFKTIFLSTSSKIFKHTYSSNIANLTSEIADYCEALIFKENRGGSRGYFFLDDTMLQIPSQTRKIVHSVGVGDTYDIAYLSKIDKHSPTDSLNYASWAAMEYASTTFPLDFKRSIERLEKIEIEKLKEIGGVILPWETRDAINIYIAGPDFDYVEKTKFDLIQKALKYHNFTPRFPIRENGQLTKESTTREKQVVCDKDIDLLKDCQILIAVLIFNDPGTLVEIGIAIASGIPTLVYDPLNLVNNCILSQAPTLVSSDLDEIISQVFILSNKN